MLTKLLTKPSKKRCSTSGKPEQKRLSTVYEIKSPVVKLFGELGSRRCLILLVPEVGIEPTRN
jgi:hypothetical protein